MKRLVQEIVAWVLIKLVNHVLPDDVISEAGEDVGKYLTDNCRKAMGSDSWEKMETEIEDVLGVFVSGLYRGLDYDDKD